MYSREQIMSRITFTGIGMLAGIVIGAAAVSGLNAQGKGPGAYAIVDINEITDPATFRPCCRLQERPTISSAASSSLALRTSSRSTERPPTLRGDRVRQHGQGQGLGQIPASGRGQRDPEEVDEVTYVPCGR